MAVQLFKPNHQALQAQIAAMKEHEAQRAASRPKRQGDIIFGSFQLGKNVVRALPATNSRGIVGKRRATHYFQQTALKGILEKGQYECLEESFPEMHDAVCPFCRTGDKLMRQFPQLQLGRWLNAAVKQQMQMVERTNPDPALQIVPQVFDVHLDVFNWFTALQADCLGRGYDITDIDQGMDFIIDVSEEVRNFKKSGEQKKFKNYKGENIPLVTLTPLHPDPSVKANILGLMKDLDEVFKYPNDEKYAALSAAASRIEEYYTNAQVKPGQVAIPGNFGANLPQQPVAPFMSPGQAHMALPHAPTPAAVMAPPMPPPAPVYAPPVPVAAPTPIVATPPPAAAPPSVPSASLGTLAPGVMGNAHPLPPPGAALAAAVAQQYAPVLVQAPVPVAPAVPPPALHIVPTAPAPVQQVPQVPGQMALPVIQNPQSPQDVPACFGGKVARPDGGHGYDSEQEICLMCRVELKCMELTNQLRVGH